LYFIPYTTLERALLLRNVERMRLVRQPLSLCLLHSPALNSLMSNIRILYKTRESIRSQNPDRSPLPMGVIMMSGLGLKLGDRSFSGTRG